MAQIRAIWSGPITCGLVNVPVQLDSATEDHDLKLQQVHDEDGGCIRYQRPCEVVDHEHIDPIRFDRSYYLEPASKSAKAHTLLRRTLEETNRTAIVQFVLRQKTRLGALRVRDDVLVLQALLWDEEMRQAVFPSLEERVSISAKELELVDEFIRSFESDFEPECFSDHYEDQLRWLVEAKLECGEAIDTEKIVGEKPEDGGGGEVLDLMEALRKSIDKSRAAGGQKKGARRSPRATMPRGNAASG